MNVVCVLTGGPFDGQTRELDYHGVPASTDPDDLPADIEVADYAVVSAIIEVPGEEPRVVMGTQGSYEFVDWLDIGKTADFIWVPG